MATRRDAPTNHVYNNFCTLNFYRALWRCCCSCLLVLEETCLYIEQFYNSILTMLSRAVRASITLPRTSGSISRGQAVAISSSPFYSPIGRKSISPAILKSSISRSMSVHHGESALRPAPDKVLTDIADYIHNYKIDSDLAFETARLNLIDTIGCGLEGLRFPECANLLGPVVEGTVVPNGACTQIYPVRCRELIVTNRYESSWNQLSTGPHSWRV